MKVTHEFEPFYNKNSEILILGSIPSPKSREQGFYYGHPKNKFWQILAIIYNEQLPITIQEKKELLTKHKIALWDVLKSCNIEGASDSTITNPKVNKLNKILRNSNIKSIYTTGKTAYNLYNKYCLNSTKKAAIYLPSTSPANCRIKLEELIEEYKTITSKH